MLQPFRVILLGSRGVGKSALLHRHFNNEFLTDDDPTQEDITFEELTIASQKAIFQFIDTGGSSYECLEKWAPICDGFILVFSLNSEKSFQRVELLLQELSDQRKGEFDKIPKVICGTFLDEGTRVVPKESVQLLAQARSCKYAEVSSKTGENIASTFDEFLKAVYRTRENTLRSSGPSIIVSTPEQLPIRGAQSLSTSDSPMTSRAKSFLNIFQKKKVFARPQEDTWSSTKHIPKDWSIVDDNTIDVTSEALATIDSSCRSNCFHLEFGKNFATTVNSELEFKEKYTPYYKLNFYQHDHYNYLAESDRIGIVLVSFDPPSESGSSRVLIRTKKGDTRLLVPEGSATSSKSILKHIRTLMPELAQTKFKRIDPSPTMDDLLAQFEEKEHISHYKFGVLNCKEGQTDEDSIYSNTEISDDYLEFLEFLGTKVELLDFPGYAAGLDTKHKTTGSHSVFTIFKTYEIMFHVASMLPYQEMDEQRVERKRHLGNDVILLIFKEGNTPFNPSWFKSHFNHSFIVVQVHEKTEEKTLYKMAVATKGGVEPFGPYLPQPPIFEKNGAFRDFLLAKLINAERASMNGGEFKATLIRTRNDMLTELSKKVEYKSQRDKSPMRLSGQFLDMVFSAIKIDDVRKSPEGSPRHSPRQSPNTSPRGSGVMSPLATRSVSTTPPPDSPNTSRHDTL